VGFEPTNPYGIGASVPTLTPIGRRSAIDFALFKKWLFQNYRPFTARQQYCYAKKFADCLLSRDLSKIAMFSESKKRHAVIALLSLSKFLGVHESFKQLVKNYGIKVNGKNNDDIVISRLLKTSNANEIFQWIREGKKKIPEICNLLELMAITGLRLVEAIECANLIIALSHNGKLNTYYNEEKQVLEHFRFKERFIRNSKKVFISFVPKDLIKRISNDKPLKYGRVQKLASWHLKKLRFGDIRELHASILTKHLSQSEIDFLHGRVGINVFMANYFNPNLLCDLKERAFKAIDEMQKQIP
jgi:intergrase/recombinase